MSDDCARLSLVDRSLLFLVVGPVLLSVVLELLAALPLELRHLSATRGGDQRNRAGVTAGELLPGHQRIDHARRRVWHPGKSSKIPLPLSRDWSPAM